MKLIGFILSSTLGLGMANASDSAKCIVLFNGSEVSQQQIFHQDYDVNISGKYSYRTHARDEFYDLVYNYETKSTSSSYKLDVQLLGDVHNYTGSATGSDGSFSAVVTLYDHESHKIQVNCNIL